jgi:hypothetical protein
LDWSDEITGSKKSGVPQILILFAVEVNMSRMFREKQGIISKCWL